MSQIAPQLRDSLDEECVLTCLSANSARVMGHLLEEFEPRSGGEKIERELAADPPKQVLVDGRCLGKEGVERGVCLT